MLFTTIPFLVFLVCVLVLFYALPKGARRYLLLGASLFFYASWNAKYLILLLGLITIDYAAAIWIHRRAGWHRRMALLVSLCANVGLLGWFKYANFVRTTWLSLIHPGAAVQPLDILLPLGISFHTFQSISYVIDVYRGEQAVITSYPDYALFVSFFPQLVAGPIVRAREFFLDYFNWRRPTSAEWQQGVTLILTGYAKKLIFADRFALAANRYFDNPAGMPGFVGAWTAAIAFGLQIFFDFSGYTDIAIGIALLFGFHFPENFRRPYLSATVTEFWRRWHMTLSAWLRDYIYIPLGGNRKGRAATYLNLMLTMLIGGLWHGANWNFIIWGGYHGAALAVERAVWGRKEQVGFRRILLTPFTFLLVCVGWVFFRAPSLHSAVYVVGEMFSRQRGKSVLDPVLWGLAGFALAAALAEEHFAALSRLAQAPAKWRTVCFVVTLLAIELFSASDRSIPFVYFQF
ncbi:MAG: MBOAT family O-acyltransferase [Terriglobia bacterium]